MTFKNWIRDRFFSYKSDGEKGEASQEELLSKEQTVQEEQQVPAEEPVQGRQDVLLLQDLLELTPDHPFLSLYELRREEILDARLPHLHPDQWKDYPEDMMEKELSGLEKIFKTEASERLKKIAILQKEREKAEEEARKRAQKDAEEGKAPAKKQEIPPIEMDALPIVHITDDRLEAWLLVFPPVGRGGELDRDMLDNALKKREVSFGLDTELLESLPDNQDRYFRLFRIAKGQPVSHGVDGYIEDFYERVVKKEFSENDHGKVDYFHLNLVQNIEKGNVICQAVPPVEGVPGRTVQDKEINCRNGKAASLPKGPNTEISEDGAKLLASISGRLEFNNSKFQVKSVLEIDGNVDFSTGNIDFVGDVHIRGDVSSGFSVKALGDITIDGVVEAAEVEAGGDLIVSKGISGDLRGVIRGHHDVYAKYMESCSVHCKGNIQADCIVNCDVYCDGKVYARSGRGTIIGGRVRAAQEVSSKIVGSRSESITQIYLGGQPCANYEKEFLALTLAKLEDEMERVERQPDSPAKEKRMAKIRLDLSVGKMKINRFDKELKKLKEKIQEQGGSRLKCDVAYPGLSLNIGDESYSLTKETSMVNARLVEGSIILM